MFRHRILVTAGQPDVCAVFADFDQGDNFFGFGVEDYFRIESWLNLGQLKPRSPK